MAIFGNLDLETIVQVNDKTRLDASKSFISTDEAAITLLEIEPEAAAGFVDVTSNQFLDWQYSTDGDKVVSVRITTDGAPNTTTETFTVISVADDKLFSADSELLPYEPNILEWVREGRNSFLDVHRESQIEIIRYLDKNGFWDVNDDPLTKDAIIDINEVNAWSKFMTLKLIFDGLNNAKDDIFEQKAKNYLEKEFEARDRVLIRLDNDADGNADTGEEADLRSIQLLKE